MKRVNTLFYCTFFDGRKQRPVFTKYGFRLCFLLSSEDFASFLHLDVRIAIMGVFHDATDTTFDDMDVSYKGALLVARDNAKKLLATLSRS